MKHSPLWGLVALLAMLIASAGAPTQPLIYISATLIAVATIGLHLLEVRQ